MKKPSLIAAVVLALGKATVLSPQTPPGPEKTFRGEIADSQCALNVHSLSQSHKEMMDMRTDLKTNADCARFCVKERGGKYVLQYKDKVYRLDKPDEAEPFAGEQVKIVGILDPKTNTITIRSITPLKRAATNPADSTHLP
jgi:uncharacterized protein DUF5818